MNASSTYLESSLESRTRKRQKKAKRNLFIEKRKENHFFQSWIRYIIYVITLHYDIWSDLLVNERDSVIALPLRGHPLLSSRWRPLDGGLISRAPKGDGGQSSLLSHPLPMVERLRTLSVEHLLDHFQNRLKSHLRAFYSHFKRPKLVRIAYLLWGQV